MTAWQVNGGIALEIAAAALQPRGTVSTTHAWAAAELVPRDIVGTGGAIEFHGSGIALLGTLGEKCCEPGHARVLVDGNETFDQTGIWQNKSSSGRAIDRAVLFAWRWPKASILPDAIWQAPAGRWRCWAVRAGSIIMRD